MKLEITTKLADVNSINFLREKNYIGHIVPLFKNLKTNDQSLYDKNLKEMLKLTLSYLGTEDVDSTLSIYKHRIDTSLTFISVDEVKKQIEVLNLVKQQINEEVFNDLKIKLEEKMLIELEVISNYSWLLEKVCNVIQAVSSKKGRDSLELRTALNTIYQEAIDETSNYVIDSVEKFICYDVNCNIDGFFKKGPKVNAGGAPGCGHYDSCGTPDTLDCGLFDNCGADSCGYFDSTLPCWFYDDDGKDPEEDPE